ncbi:hypothetical protein C8Q75DRAFT_744368 [Abortiporus biennis]|nr:hypothetical protein C8Q75DRAFT_744368 [Abortiporus biennis]
MALTSRKVAFLDLPHELVAEILTYLHFRDLLRVTTLCRTLNQTVTHSVELQYKIELGADGMVDGPRTPGSMPIADRLRLLLDRRKRWQNLDWTQQITLPLHGACQAYEMVAGVFAKTMTIPGHTGSRYLACTWLPTRSEPAHTLVKEDIGIPSRDFAIDPSQDLIALVDVDESFDNIQIQISLRTISTNKQHPLASKAELIGQVPLHVNSCFIQFVQDVVGMFFWVDGPGLMIWNWHTGELVVRALQSELHHGTWDFSFLSSRAFMLTTIGGSGSIEIYSFSGHAITHEDGSLVPPAHAASLRLPDLKDPYEIRKFSTHSSPFLGGNISRGKPFTTSQENRVHLMSIHYGAQGPRFHLLIKNDFLLSHVPPNFAYQDQSKAVTKQWSEWGVKNSRFLEHNVSFKWLRYVHGQRVVLPPFPISGRPGSPNHKSKVCIIDFNVWPRRKVRDGEVFDNLATGISTVPAMNIFEEDVVSSLPYAVYSRVGPFEHSGFMIDEERLVGLQLPQSHQESDLGDIDVFTF